MEKIYDLHLSPGQAGRGGLWRNISAEKFFRLNPHWNIMKIISEDEEFSMEGTDHSSGAPVVLSGKYTSGNQLDVQVTDCYWNRIVISKLNDSISARVTYTREPSEDEERHVVLWLRSIKEYLRLHLKTTPVTLFFRIIMDRIILQMNPSQRKISLMLIRITIVELFVILLIIVGYVFFMK
jgi:hypothetical protein